MVFLSICLAGALSIRCSGILVMAGTFAIITDKSFEYSGNHPIIGVDLPTFLY